jgi:hypothetical protein
MSSLLHQYNSRSSLKLSRVLIEISLLNVLIDLVTVISTLCIASDLYSMNSV